MRVIREEDAKDIHGEELGEALILIKDLRDHLQLVQHNHGDLKAKDVD